jgi:hypothetical protein
MSDRRNPSIDEQTMYEAITGIATKEMSKDDFFAWVESHIIEERNEETGF